MTRRCSVMRMPLAAQRASISLDFCSITTFLRGFRISRQGGRKSMPQSIATISQVAAQHQCRRPLAVGVSNSLRGVRPRRSRRAGRAGAPAVLPSSTSRKMTRDTKSREPPMMQIEHPPRKPLAAVPAATATDRISASPAAMRDMMNPTSRPSTAARCVQHVAVDEEPIDFVLAPAAVEGRARAAWQSRRRRAASPPTARARLARTGG